MPPKPRTIDEALAGFGAEQRAALQKIRKAIHAAAPKAEEGINYGVPAFLLNGKAIAGFAAAAGHCSYFPMSGAVVAALRADLKGYDTSKGTIRFPANKPLPAALVRKLVKARVAEIEESSAKAPAKKSAQGAAKTEPGGARSDPAVASFLRGLKHPLKPEIEAVRRIILGVSPSIREGIKWNSPSFRTTEWFATLNLRAKGGEKRVWLILHLGAKAKDDTKDLRGADPNGLVEWLANDRGLVTFRDAKDIQAKRPALEALLREWIKHVS